MQFSLIFSNSNDQSLLASAGLRDYPDFVNCASGEIVAQGSDSTMRRLSIRHAKGEHHYYLKVYRFTGRRRRWAFQGDKVSAEVRNARTLATIGINVPETICHGSRAGLLRIRDSFLVTKAIPGAMPLDAFVDSHVQSRNDAQRRVLFQSLATLIRQMHDAHFFHIDLQWRNILVASTSGGAPMLYLIDSTRGGLRPPGIRAEHGRLRDLSSLAKDAQSRLTRTELARWLRAYLGVPCLAAEHRLIIQTIERDRILKDNSGRA